MNKSASSAPRDLVNGPIVTGLVSFAAPTLASNILQSLNGSVNAMWVGRLLGEASFAATSNANLIMFLIYSLIFGFGMATTVLIAQNMGRRDLEAVRKAIGAGITMFALLGIAVAWIGWLLLPAMLDLMKTPGDVHPQALSYARTVLLGLPAGLLIVFLQFALRGTGDAVTPLLFIVPSALIDVALNPVFILGLGPAPRLGIAGSALAGVIANYVTLAMLIAYIYARDLPIRLRGAELAWLRPARALLAFIFKKGVPMGLQMIVVSASSLALMGLVNREGTTLVAAYGAANQVWTYLQMPAIAISAAASTMAAQNIGGGRWDRIGPITWLACVLNLAMALLLVVVSLTFHDALLGLFLGSNAPVLAAAGHLNAIASWGFVLAALMMVLGGIPRANGATIVPLLISAVSLLPGRLGLAIALKPVIGVDAIWWSFPISFGIATLLSFLFYRFGGWRKTRLIEPMQPAEVEEAVQAETEPAGRSHPAA